MPHFDATRRRRDAVLEVLLDEVCKLCAGQRARRIDAQHEKL